jgi:nicotinamidase-related amidase
MGQRRIVGWVVDVQNDFMRPDGRLYVKHLGDESDAGAVQVEGTIAESVAWMREHADVVVFTGDWHGLDDPEIDPVSPDPTAGTYPPHCMGRSDDADEREGAWIVPSIRPEDPLVLEVDADAEAGAAVARAALESGRPVFIRKTRFDVFAGNAATEAFVATLSDALDDPEFVVVGVARDVCVTQAVDGLLERERRVTALSDATWGLGLESEADTLARWSAGGRVTTLAERRAEDARG